MFDVHAEPPCTHILQIPRDEVEGTLSLQQEGQPHMSAGELESIQMLLGQHRLRPKCRGRRWKLACMPHIIERRNGRKCI